MRLTLLYGGSPQNSKIINAETGEVLERVRSFAIRTDGHVDILTIEVLVEPDIAVDRKAVDKLLEDHGIKFNSVTMPSDTASSGDRPSITKNPVGK